MKSIVSIILGCTMFVTSTMAGVNDNLTKNDSDSGGKDAATELAKHAAGAKKLANEQDELSADVQDLIDEQTDPKVIELLREIEVIMADATDLLEQKETGGVTIAVETEVIEKIFEAAKKKKDG